MSILSPKSLPFEGLMCMERNYYVTVRTSELFKGSRDDAVVRALASHLCGLVRFPDSALIVVICGLSLFLVLLREVFLLFYFARLLRKSSDKR